MQYPVKPSPKTPLPGRSTLISDAERNEFFSIPCDEESFTRHYTLTPEEQAFIRQRRDSRNALALAVHLAYLTFPGRAWSFGEVPPRPLVENLAQQLGFSARVLREYAPDKAVHSRMTAAAMGFLNLRPPTNTDHGGMEEAAREEARHTDKGSLIVRAILEHLRENKIAFPAPAVVERAGLTGRAKAEAEAIEAIVSRLTPEQQERLPTLLQKNKVLEYTTLAWLRGIAENPSADGLAAIKERLDYIRGFGLNVQDIRDMSPWRFHQLAREGAKVSSHNLARYGSKKVVAILAAQLANLETTLIDAGGEMFCRLIGDRFSRSRKRQKQAVVDASKNARLVARMYSRLVATIAAAKTEGRDIGQALAEEHDLDELCSLKPVADDVAALGDDATLRHVAEGYSHIRSYAPTFLEMFDFEMSNPDHPLLKAIGVLRELNKNGTRKVPDDAPLSMFSDSWQDIVTENGDIDRHFYETAVLATIRDRMCSRDLAVKGSSAYQPFARLMVSREVAAELAPRLGIETNSEAYLASRAEELDTEMQDTFRKLRKGQLEGVTYDNGKLTISPVTSISTKEIEAAAAAISDRLPVYRITELFKRVDAETSVFQCFTDANGREHHDRNVLMAVIWATASNLPLEKMAASSQEMTYRQLAWAHEHYLTEDNFQAATAKLIDLQHKLPLASHWGNGAVTSSDGQFVSAGRKRNGFNSFNPKYSNEPGLKFYDTTTDQYAPLYTRVLPASMPEIIHVLDGLVLHRTGLAITEHMMDTGGASDIVFAVGRLMSTIINPRYRDFGDLRFGIMRPAKTYKNVQPLLGPAISTALITEYFEEFLRLGVSLREGKVLPSQVLREITAGQQQNKFARALSEFGRIDRTAFMLRWISQPELRRHVQVMLNKGEMGHILSDTIRMHRQGNIMDRTREHQSLRAKAIQFVKAMVIWANTLDGQLAIDGLRAEGRDVPDEVLGHISPLGSRHILFNGDYLWRKPWRGMPEPKKPRS